MRRKMFPRLAPWQRATLAILMLVLIAVPVVLGMGLLGGEPRASPPEGLGIAAGDEVLVDVTTLLNGRVWRTTQPFIAELLQIQLYGNLTGFNASEFVPTRLPAGGEVPRNPVLSAVAAELPGRRIGDHFELALIEPFGPASEVQTLQMPRWWGPFPKESTWPFQDFNTSFGTPQVGSSVATNKLFNSTVKSVHDSIVTTVSEARNGDVVALPFFNAFLHVAETPEGALRFRVDPVQNVSFQVQAGRTYFGLESGHYVVTNLTEETITYLHHPAWSPYLVGMSFDLIVDIRAPGYVWSPVATRTSILPQETTTP